MISSINNNNTSKSFKIKDDDEKLRKRKNAFSAFQKSRLMIQQQKQANSQSKSTLNENYIIGSNITTNNVNQKQIEIETKSQEIRLFNLEYIYRTKLPLWFHRFKSPVLDWLLLTIFPEGESGKIFFHFVVNLFVRIMLI